MSNALYNLATIGQETPAATSAPPIGQQAPLEGWFVAVLAVGIVLAAVWVIRRLVYPRKFSLARTPGRSNRIHPVHLLIFFAAWQLLGAAAHEALTNVVPAADELNVLVTAILGVAILIAGMIMAEACFDLGLVRGMGLTLRHWRSGTVRGVVAGLIALPACWGLLWLTLWATAALGGTPDAGHPVFHVMASAAPFWRALIALLPIVLAPLSEEVLFRGLVQSMVRQYTRRPWVAILVTSGLFVGLHWGVWTTIPALLFLSIVLGYNYERTGRLLPSIVAHAVFNAIFVLKIAAETAAS